MERLTRFAIFIISILILGCGYKMGTIIPSGTVAVITFDNKTLYRQYEFFLTQALMSEISMRTSLKTSDVSNSDTILSGTIVQISANTIRKNEQREATELDITVSVEINWKDTRTGQFIVRNNSLSETTQIISNRGENFDNSIVQSLRKLARSIVYAMEQSYWQ